MVFENLDEKIQNHTDWVLRRQRNIPNNRRLFVLACMDERLPVEEALGISLGDAHVFRNAGGLVTDDVIRSAMLTTNFFGTEEIIIVNHTECGMMSAKTETILRAIEQKVGSLAQVSLDPALPELTLTDPLAFGRWVKMFDDVDRIAETQVKLLRSHPLIPAHVTIHSYIYEIETERLRKPHERLAEHVNDARTMTEHPLLG